VNCQYCRVCAQIPKIAHIRNSANFPLVFFLEHVGLASRLYLQHVSGRGRGWYISAGFIFQDVSEEKKYFFEADLNIICRHGHVVIALYTIPNNICK
jgi:hypothetical protein